MPDPDNRVSSAAVPLAVQTPPTQTPPELEEASVTAGSQRLRPRRRLDRAIGPHSRISGRWPGGERGGAGSGLRHQRGGQLGFRADRVSVGRQARRHHRRCRAGYRQPAVVRAQAAGPAARKTRGARRRAGLAVPALMVVRRPDPGDADRNRCGERAARRIGQGRRAVLCRARAHQVGRSVGQYPRRGTGRAADHRHGQFPDRRHPGLRRRRAAAPLCRRHLRGRPGGPGGGARDGGGDDGDHHGGRTGAPMPRASPPCAATRNWMRWKWSGFR